MTGHERVEAARMEQFYNGVHSVLTEWIPFVFKSALCIAGIALLAVIL